MLIRTADGKIAAPSPGTPVPVRFPTAEEAADYTAVHDPSPGNPLPIGAPDGSIADVLLASKIVKRIAAPGATMCIHSGVVADGETITFGDVTFEFDSDANVTPGNLAVDITGDLTPADNVAGLLAVLNSTSACPVTGETHAELPQGPVFYKSKITGVAANGIACSTTAVDLVMLGAALSGGADASVSVMRSFRHYPTADEISNNWIVINTGMASIDWAIALGWENSGQTGWVNFTVINYPKAGWLALRQGSETWTAGPNGWIDIDIVGHM